MSQRIALGLALLAGVAIGATAVNGLHAQNSAPGAYAVSTSAKLPTPTFSRHYLPKVGASNAASGAHNVILTEKIVGLDGTPPKRFIVLAFDSMEKAKAWDASAAQKEITGIRTKSTKSRAFLADGAIN